MLNVDSAVVTRVTNALLIDPHTREAVIEVSSQGGAVTLSGTVPSEEIRRTAETIARRQPGVIIVVNDLRLQSD